MATKKAATTAAPARFNGFADTECAFFHALDEHQDRDWYTAHKRDFDEGWSAPMSALLTEVRDNLAGAYKGVALREPKVFRLQRDVRFSLDKTPYKTNVSGVLSTTGRGASHETPAAVYLQLGVESLCAGGLYAMMGDTVDRYRAALLDARAGAALAKLTDALVAKGYTLDAIETLKTAPRGVDKAHPRIELLKRKGLVVMFPEVPRAKLTSRDLVDWVTAHALEAAPVVRWLAKHTA
jgi:uncharacterized protein (TIGR02453 family)